MKLDLELEAHCIIWPAATAVHPLDLTPSLSFYLSSHAAVRSVAWSVFRFEGAWIGSEGYLKPSEAAFREATASVPVRPGRFERMNSLEEERADDGVRRVIPSRLRMEQK